MKIDAILFDLDGTLLDTLEDLADSCNNALNDAGLPSLPLEEYKSHVGSGARNLVSAAMASAHTVMSGEPCRKSDLDKGYTDRIFKLYREIYSRSWSSKTVIYEGITDLLTALREKNIKLAVLSNKPDDFTKIMVDYYFPAGTFDMVYGLSESWPAKPDPGLALDICRQFGVKPENTVLVGDSGSDMETALRAGMIPLGVLWGFRDAKELKKAGAESLFSKSAELAEFLLSSC